MLVMSEAAAAPPRYSGPTQLRAEARPSVELRACGIGLSPEELIEFLNRGISDPGRLPDEPEEKSQLVIDAMAKLAQAKAQAAVPVIQRIASLELPGGARQMVDIDLQRTAPDGREDFRGRALRLLQYNAVNALSLIGDKASLPLIRSIFKAETSAAARVQYAICLASLGDASGVDFLVDIIQRENRRESAAAARAFTIITGQDFGYSEKTPVRARRSRAAMYNQWWAANKREFRPEITGVNQRRSEPVTAAVYHPRNTRDLLKLAANYFDFQNATKSVEARAALKEAGNSLNGELERIAQDVNEDLDVRMEAMNWYYEANRSGAKSLMKRLKKDENPEISDKAETLLDQIEEDLHPPAPQVINR
jgi:hypothetical protein